MGASAQSLDLPARPLISNLVTNRIRPQTVSLAENIPSMQRYESLSQREADNRNIGLCGTRTPPGRAPQGSTRPRNDTEDHR
jgi:hypothetical protein